MKIVIEFDKTTNVFTAQFDRGLTSAAEVTIPPPPPYQDQLVAMTGWLNKSYPSVMDKFRDSEVSGLRITFQAPPGKP
jgi:hypothetical protein